MISAHNNQRTDLLFSGIFSTDNIDADFEVD